MLRFAGQVIVIQGNPSWSGDAKLSNIHELRAWGPSFSNNHQIVLRENSLKTWLSNFFKWVPRVFRTFFPTSISWKESRVGTCWSSLYEHPLGSTSGWRPLTLHIGSTHEATISVKKRGPRYIRCTTWRTIFCTGRAPQLCLLVYKPPEVPWTRVILHQLYLSPMKYSYITTINHR